MTQPARRVWAERAVRGLNAAFPLPDFENWATCERLAQQGLAASEPIATYELQSNVV